MPYLGIGLRAGIELRIERPTISVASSWRVIGLMLWRGYITYFCYDNNASEM